ncbi:MAG: phosphoribosyltransferase family protein [Treponemataceae bacterium]
MKKIFVKADTVRNNAFFLARRLLNENYIPDIMYVSMRGGAPMGNAMNEFFKFALGKNYKINFATVVASSYLGVNQNSQVKFAGWTYPPEKILTSQKVLVVDDICDSGATLKKLSEKFAELGLKKNMVRFAVHDFKKFNYAEAKTVNFTPDYFCYKHEINSEEENLWFHYLSHELIGLTKNELKENYLKDYPELNRAFDGLI